MLSITGRKRGACTFLFLFYCPSTKGMIINTLALLGRIWSIEQDISLVWPYCDTYFWIYTLLVGCPVVLFSGIEKHNGILNMSLISFWEIISGICICMCWNTVYQVRESLCTPHLYACNIQLICLSLGTLSKTGFRNIPLYSTPTTQKQLFRVKCHSPDKYEQDRIWLIKRSGST